MDRIDIILLSVSGGLIVIGFLFLYLFLFNVFDFSGNSFSHMLHGEAYE
jgi:hypothetical protein